MEKVCDSTDYDLENGVTETKDCNSGDQPLVKYTYPRGSTGGGCGSCGAAGKVFSNHPISMEKDGQDYYYLYDGKGSVTEVIDSNEDVVNSYRYTPFSQERVKTESVSNPYRYKGQRYDEERGQYYFGGRSYSSFQKRFTGRSGGSYVYSSNNPMNPTAGVEGALPSGRAGTVGGEAGFDISVPYRGLEPAKREGHRRILPDGVPPAMIDGGGAGSLTDCPEATWKTFEHCVWYYNDLYIPESAQEKCVDVCFEDEVPNFDYAEFWGCLFPTRPGWDTFFMWANHIGCGSAILGAIVAATGSGGLAPPLAASLIAAGCVGEAGAITMCLNQAWNG